jgi:hypothetical protein
MDILWEVSMELPVASKRSRKCPTLGADLEELALEVTRLPALDVPALRQRWAALFGAEPSLSFGRGLLLRAIAHRLQEKASASLHQPSGFSTVSPMIAHRTRRKLCLNGGPVPGPC